MLVDDVIALSIPFALSVVIQLLQPGVRAYAGRFSQQNLPKSTKVSPAIEKAMINLAVCTYTHLSFVFSILMSSLSCLTYTVLSTRPIFAAVGVMVMITMLPIWLIYWQGLSAEELQQNQGKWMNVSAWLSIIVLWIITLYVRLEPIMFNSSTP